MTNGMFRKHAGGARTRPVTIMIAVLFLFGMSHFLTLSQISRSLSDDGDAIIKESELLVYNARVIVEMKEKLQKLSVGVDTDSVADMNKKLDEINENIKLLLAKPQQILSEKPTTRSAAPFPYHVLYGLDGNETGFLEELQVSLKSVLLNAPLDDPLEIHLLASETSYKQLDQIFQTTLLSSFQTRNQITIHAYNVQPLMKSWEKFMIQFFSTHWNSTYNLAEQTRAHTIGAFFRRFAHTVLPESVGKILYMDNDAVLMANMQELWKDVAANNPNAMFHWGEYACSGFMVLDNHRMQDIWNLAAKSNLSAMPEVRDQLMLQSVNASFPEEIGILPPAWDVSVANSIWQFNEDLVKIRPDIGMMHFNGGRGDPGNAFQVHKYINPDTPRGLAHSDWRRTFHLASYYANMPWEWTRYWAKSMVGNSELEGYPIKIVHHENFKPLNVEDIGKAW